MTDSNDVDAKAKQVTSIRREYTLTETGKIEFKVYLGVGGRESQLHLQGELSKVDAE